VPRDGALTLGEYPGNMVRLVCHKCGRRGRYSKARLIAQHGAGIRLPVLRHILARCQRSGPDGRPIREADPCGVQYEGLGG
jgi:hypothetical protein